MDNYPAGVTGRELQIAGPDAEYTRERTVSCWNDECSQFEIELDAEVDIWSYGSEEHWTWTCPACKITRDFDEYIYPDDDEYEPDRYMD